MAGDHRDPSQISTRDALAQALTDLRESRGLTVRDLAQLADVPVATLGGYLSGRHLPPIAATSPFERVLSELGASPSQVDEWLDAVRRVRRTPGRRPSDVRSPYRGLEAYGPQDAGLFVGREDLIAALIKRVEDEPSKLILVVGPSGSGKSSLLRAGLAVGLAARGREVSVAVPDDLDALPPVAAGSVLIVDQFEGVFAAKDSGGPGRMAEALDGYLRDEVRVVVAIRSDFLDQALGIPACAAWSTNGLFPVPPLTAEQLRRVIVEPALRLGFEVDDALVEVLVAEAVRPGEQEALEPGALPLVSHALYETWASATGRHLTLDHYRQVGGLAGAVANTAEALFARLEPEGQVEAKSTLLRLVHVGEGTPDTRRQVDRALFTGASAVLVEAGVADRLLTADEGRVQLAHEVLLTAWPRLREWIAEDRELLKVRARVSNAARDWDGADRSPDLLFRGSVLDTVLSTGLSREHLTGVEREFVVRSELAEQIARERKRAAERRLRRLTLGLAATAIVSTVLAGIVTYQDRESDKDRSRATARELALTAHGLSESGSPVAGQVALAAFRTADVVESRSALVAVSGEPQVVRLATVDTIVNALRVGDDGLLAMGTQSGSVQLWSTVPGPVARSSLPADATGVFSIDVRGEMLVAGGGTGELRAWSMASPDSPSELDVLGPSLGAPILSVAINDAGTHVAVGTAGGQVGIWRIGPGGFVLESSAVAFEGTVQSVHFRGDFLLAGGTDGALTVFETHGEDGLRAISSITVVESNVINAIEVSADGERAYIGARDHAVYVVSLSDPRAPVVTGTLTGPASWINSLALSPDGQTLAATSSDCNVWTWDVSNGAVTSRFPGPSIPIGVAWSTDGTSLVAAGSDGVVREWAWPTPVIGGLSSIVTMLPSDGDLLFGATTTGLRIWDVSEPLRPVELSRTPAESGERLNGSLTVVPGRDLAIAGTADGPLVIFDTSDPSAPRRIGSLATHTEWVEDLDIDPSERWLAVGADDGLLSIWDLEADPNSAPVATIATPGLVFSVDFSPDGRLLAVGVLTMGDFSIYDMSDPTSPLLIAKPRLTGTSSVYGVGFSPDGDTLAVSDGEGGIWRWDVTTPSQPKMIGTQLRASEGYATAVGFSPDSTMLGASMSDGSMCIWDLSSDVDPEQVLELTPGIGLLYGFAFLEDGTHLVAGGADRSIRMWDLAPSSVEDRVCAAEARGVGMTDAEWARIAGDLPMPRMCS